MLKEQEHSINKVLVEVNTKSKKVANEFKNSLEAFLQQEIFPLIESFFENSGILNEEEVQLISKLTLEIDLNRKDESFRDKRVQQKIKEQIVKELSKVIENPESKENVIESKPLIQSKTDAFFYFLREGRTAWWNSTKDEVEFTSKVLFEITEVTTYEARFLKVIKIPIQSERLIRQFLNKELQILFLGIRNKPKGYLERVSAITNFNFTNNEVREVVWKVFIDAILEQKVTELVNKVKERVQDLERKKTSQEVVKELNRFVSFLVENTLKEEKEILRNVNYKTVKENTAIISQQINTIEKKKEEKLIEKEKLQQQEKERGIKLQADVSDVKNEQVSFLKLEKEDAVGKKEIKEDILNEKDNNLTGSRTIKSSNEEKGVVYAKDKKENKGKEENQIQRKFEEKIHFKSQSKVSKTYLAYNAGLILLHPFLKQLFKSCEFLDSDYKIVKPNEAVHLLHYLATKKEQQLESNLLFEKFLCNIPIQQPLERNIYLSDTVKREAEEMLKGVLQNWESMKNASVDLFRNEFLQRVGKIDLTKEHPHIIVERKTQDILLDKLPWNYSLCKLPWMHTLIFTDW